MQGGDINEESRKCFCLSNFSKLMYSYYIVSMLHLPDMSAYLLDSPSGLPSVQRNSAVLLYSTISWLTLQISRPCP